MTATKTTAQNRTGRRATRPVDPSAPILSAEQELELAARIQAGDAQARETLILANLRLVLSIASDYRGRKGSVDHDDLIQEGNIGLMRAARDFDPATHGTRFGTYAAMWIRHFIQRVLTEQSSLIRRPYYLVLLNRRFEKTRSAMIESARASTTADGPIEPSLEAIADRMGVERRRLRFIRYAQIEIRSYNTPAADDVDDDESQDGSLAQSLPPEAPLETAEAMERLHRSMRQLPLLESWVLRRRYRLNDTAEESAALAEGRGRRRRNADQGPAPARVEDRRPYREISEEIGRPIHQIRQAEHAALARLRKSVDLPFDAPTESSTAPLSRRLERRRSA